MELGDSDPLNDGGGGGAGAGGGGSFGSVSSVASVSCSICLEVVTDNGERSRAKLQCGHEFHLDCIGSAFNAKGMMQCPNCRKIEEGRWLYGNGPRSHAEFSMMDEWVHDEDLYDQSYSEMPFGVHWCPFSGLPRVPPSFEEGEPPSSAYHDLVGHHTIFAEHTAGPPTAGHSCPYIAYFQLQPSSSSSNESITDGPTFSHHWSGGMSGPSEISTSHTFTTVDLHYHSWDHPPSFSGGPDQALVPAATLRPMSGDSDSIPRSGSFMHPFLFGPGSGPRAGNSFVSSMVPPIPNGISRGHDRVQGLHAYQRQQQQQQQQQLTSNEMRTQPMFAGGVRRSGAPRGGMAPVRPVASSLDNGNGFVVFPSSGTTSGQNLQEAENPVRNRLYAWERDRFAPFPLIPVDRESSWWTPFHQPAAESNGRGSSFWPRNGGSERTASQNRSDSSTYQQHINPSGRLHRFM